MRIAYLSFVYPAPIEYYTRLLEYDKIYVEQHDHYIKQTYRNRCTIAGPDGELALSISTAEPDILKCPMKDIRILDHSNQRRLHWNAIGSAYNSTSYFKYYKDDLCPFYEKKYGFSADFDEGLRQLARKLIDIQPCIERTSECKTEFTTEETDFRKIIHPKKDFRVADPEFVPRLYYQIFDSKLGFLPNLSIIDLLFNTGPESLLVLTSK